MGGPETSKGTGNTSTIQKAPSSTTVRPAPAPVPKPRVDPPAQAADRSSATVLVVDRNWREGASIRNSLEAAGYEVTTWIDPEDGRESLRGRKYDLVVASTNAGQALDALIADLRPLRPPPKVILVTDEDEGDAAARCFLPTVVVVNRPFKIAEVADIADHLSGARSG